MYIVAYRSRPTHTCMLRPECCGKDFRRVQTDHSECARNSKLPDHAECYSRRN